MAYTSDQQLAALGLKPLEHLPTRDGLNIIGHTRDGRDVPCRIFIDRNKLAHLDIDAPDVIFGHLVGWRDA